jgi:hypothetical protein
MGKKVIIGILTIPILILLFLFFRILYCQSWLTRATISTEIVPLDVFNLIITSGLTLFLAWYITKRLTEQRYEKEYIIEDLKNIEEQINYIERLTGDIQTIQLQPLLEIFNKLQNHIERFNKTSEVFNISCKDSLSLSSNYNSLYKKATDIDGLQLDIDSIKRNEIHTTCSNFVITTRSLICEINKL